MDPILDDPERREWLEYQLQHFELKNFYYVKGVLNRQFDMLAEHKRLGTITIEVKNRFDDYGDYAAELTQYAKVSHKLKDMLETYTTDEIFAYLETYSTGWLFHTKAMLIVYVTPSTISYITTKLLKDYVKQNFKELQLVYSTLTTGSYSAIIPYSKDTKQFILRKEILV